MRLEFLIVFLVYILVGTVLAAVSRRFFRGSLRDYYAGGGRLGAFLSFGTYAATTYSAFMMLGLVGLAYTTGVGALGFELVYLAATVVLLSTIGYRVWSLSKNREWISPSQMLGDLYSSRLVEIITSAIYLFAMLPYLTAQVKGLSIVFNYGGLSPDMALIASLILVYAWIPIAGMWSVAITDTYQGLIMISCGLAYLAWVLLILVPSSNTTVEAVFSALGEKGYLGLTSFWSPLVFIAYTLPWVFFAITNPQVVVRLYIQRDEKAYRRSVVYFFIFGFTYTIIVVLVGLVARGLAVMGLFPGNLPRDYVTPRILDLMNPILGSIIAVSIVAAAISTANSIVLAVSSSLVATIGKRGSVMVARIVDAILVVIAGLMASANIGFIVDLSVLTSVILLPLVPVTITPLLVKPEKLKYTRKTAPLSLVAGVGLATYYAYTLGPGRAFLEVVYGLPVSGLVLLVSTLILLTGLIIDYVS